jgi:hypothetical protein
MEHFILLTNNEGKWLGEQFPSDALYYATNRGLGNRELIPNRRICQSPCVESPDLPDLVLRKFCHPVGYSRENQPPSFRNAIAGIVAIRPKKKVRRAKARAVVAFVADKQSLRDFSIRQPVGEAMDKNLTAKITLSDRYSSVAVACSDPNPLQARIPFRDSVEHFAKQVVVGSLIEHLRSLLGSGCMAPSVLMHGGAASILAFG